MSTGSASLHRLRTRADRLSADQAAQLRQLVLDWTPAAGPPIPPAAVRAVLAAVDASTAAANGWTFVMLSPAQHLAVTRRLVDESQRPKLAVVLWAEILTALRIDTGEVMISRADLAERCGASPSHVSQVLGDLDRIGAITRGKAGAIHVNPLVATHTTGASRADAQAAARPVAAKSADEYVYPTTPSRAARGSRAAVTRPD